ncbi:MAG: UvrD-helicase domain-containing protein [Chitinophagales bacterium]
MQTAQIYIASAGSGKTFTLVKEYLKILFQQAHHGNLHVYRNILAITFTNKATHEMKERIIKELNAIASGKASDQLSVLQNELSFIKDFKPLADKILVALLHDYSNFNVQTIDSFFQNIIRSFARELELPLNFEIILDISEAFEFAVDELIDQIGKDEEITNWLKEFAFSKIDEDKSWNFRKNIIALSKEIFTNSFDLNANGFELSELKVIKSKLYKEINAFETNIKTTAKQALDVLVELQFPMEGFTRSSLPRYLEKVATGDIVTSYTKMSDTLKDMLSGQRSYFSKAFEKSHAAEILQLKNSAFPHYILQLTELLDNNMGRYIANVEIYKNIYTLGVINSINTFIKAYRKEKNALFLIDATKLIKGFIELNNIPFLFEKLAAKTQYLFIDEFQDTSTIQWQNLMPIIEHILGSSASGIHVLMVGDAKQSIYRWRNGDYELLTYKAKASLQKFEVGEQALSTNYRSLPSIIDFNNRFFAATASIAQAADDTGLRTAVDQIYQSLEQMPSKSYATGKVGFEVIVPNDEQTWEEIALEKMLNNITELRQKGYALNDMAILVRKKSHGIEISRYLQDHQIDILSEETLLLQHNDAVKLLLAGLHYMSDPSVDLYYTNFIWQLFQHHHFPNVSQHEIFTDHKSRSLLKQWLPNFDSGKKEKVAVFDAVEFIIDQTNLDGSQNLFVEHFKQLVFNFFKTESSGIRDFLEYWMLEEDKQSIQLKSGTDKINVLTIHKSKGLEFPVVLIPYCNWDIFERLHENYLWLKDEHIHPTIHFPIRVVSDMSFTHFAEDYLNERKLRWIDSINLMYVAFTRAKEVLYVTTPFTKESSSSPIPLSASQFIIAALTRLGASISSQTDTSFELGSLENLLANDLTEQDKNANGVVPLKRMTTHVQQPVLKSSFESKEIRVGNLVHLALYYLAANGSYVAFQKAVNEGSYSVEEIELAGEHFEKFTADGSLYMQWVSTATQSWDEQPLYYHGQLYRPDKIFRIDDSYIVVDYKTGVENQQYHSKVRLYVEALQSLGVSEKIKAYILYSESGNLVEVV